MNLEKKLYLNVVVLSSDADMVDSDVSKSVNETSLYFWKEKKCRHCGRGRIIT
jgi:hypothetical protein